MHTKSDHQQSDARAGRADRFGMGLLAGLALATVSCLGSYLLGFGYEWGGWLFVVPFLSAYGLALLFGATMRPALGLVASVVLAAALIVAFGLGLDARYWFNDPAIREGYQTWVMLSVVAVPSAWLIGVVIRRLWHQTRPNRGS